MAEHVSFEMRIDRISVDETAATLDLEHPPTPKGKEVPDELLKERVAWFAGLNDEYGPDCPIRVAIYCDDGRRFRAGQRVRISVEPIDG